MKKHLLNIVAAVLAVCLFAACSSVSDKTDNNEGKLQIVTTIFPEYDWVKNVLGTNPANADVTLLLDKGVDLHSYQPSAEDIIKIADSDIFIYVGGESGFEDTYPALRTSMRKAAEKYGWNTRITAGIPMR